MAISNQDIFRYTLAIVIFVAFIAMIVYFFKGLKNKNYEKAKIFAIVYVCSNALRLILEHFKLY
jgi:type IV secretory pathway TrbL component